jgi:hypothetical protein
MSTPNPIIFPSSDPKTVNYIKKITNYVDNELSNKKNSIEKMLEIENRLNKFTDTYNKRYIEYIKIIGIVVFSIICIWLCIMIDGQGILPEGFLNYILIIILGISIILIYYIYQNVLMHNLLIFDEIDYKSPALEGTNVEPTGTPNVKSVKTPCPICPANYEYNGEYCVISHFS